MMEVYVKSPNHQTIYCNSTRVGITGWDIRVIFGEGQQVTEESVTVVMAPAHAKAFVKGVADAVRAYEAKWQFARHRFNY
jgi:hypothetical protein